jgi:putative toxin-antitoxin system antitoxin component (TIGR02293 family)
MMVFARTVSVFDTPANAAEWLRTPIWALNGTSPIERLDTSDGINLVKKILLRIEHGVFS